MAAIDALKISTSLSADFITAGTPCTITTKITNAHDDKIELLQIYYFIPHQVRWIDEVSLDEESKKQKEQKFFKRIFASSKLWKSVALPEGVDMIFGIGSENYEKSFASILPGESYVYSYEAYLPKWLFSSGFTVKFDGRVSYKYKDEVHYSTFSLNFLVRPPIESNIIGAVIGGVLGTSAKWLQGTVATKETGLDITFMTSTLLSIILGIVMVVFSSRRTGEVQPILTIEDFWGGMLAGFLVGYLGHEFFGKVVPLAK